MKNILMSIRPKWIAKILNKEKTIEVRKRFPSNYVGWVYIYCTKEDSLGRIKDTPHDRYFVDCVETQQDFEKMDSGYDGKGMVVARFWCDKVEEYFGGAYVIRYSLNYSFEDLRKDVLKNADEEDREIELKELEWYEQFLKDTQLTREELRDYVECKDFSAIHITKIEIFDKPMPLNSFYYARKPRKDLGLPKSWKQIVTRPPQSFMFIEV